MTETVDNSEAYSQLTALCAAELGMVPLSFTPLAQAGGDRCYWRLSLPDGGSVLGVRADSTTDAKAFVKLSESFRANGVNVPLSLCHTDDCRYYLVEDLGDVSLFSQLGSESDEQYVAQTLRELVKMQTLPLSSWESAVAYKPFSQRQILWDLNYFKYEFLKPSGVDFDEDSLEDDFARLADKLLCIPRPMWGFMMRDCQSRNVMMVGDGQEALIPYFIDFQGGRLGPCIYDAVSLLWQAKAGFDPAFRGKMMRVYADELAAASGVESDEIMSYVSLFAFFRTLQVLGAYGFRGLVQKRAHFIESIPAALRNLSEFVNTPLLDQMPELHRVVLQLIDDSRFSTTSDAGLRIKVFSFSYKKGYPEDYTGNGGGFMFDCRGMHNPGRYDEYKPLTGLDQPVIDFLKERGEVDEFVDKAVGLVSPSIETYLRRGFKSLQIGFGCTGGRHRSVYCAEALSTKLHERYPEATVEVIHREQNIRKTLL